MWTTPRRIGNRAHHRHCRSRRQTGGGPPNHGGRLKRYLVAVVVFVVEDGGLGQVVGK
jgi:hypothetical protein